MPGSSLELGGLSNLLTFPAAVVGTQLRDINPFSRLVLKLQREIYIMSDNLPLQLCFHKYRKKKGIFLSADFLDDTTVFLIGDL